jgi:hypothetical protein
MRVVVTWNVGRISLLLAGGVAHAIQGFPGEPVLPGNGQAARPARGFSYWNEQVPDIPWSVHVVAIDRGHPGVALHTTYGDGRRFGMALLSEQVKALPSALGLPVAAVNGDFYGESRRYEGRPRDLQIRAGELVTGPKGHTCFWIDPDGNPHMTNLQSRLRVVWPDQTETPLGLNEERAADAAVLFTTAVGDSTRTRGGRELRLGRGDDGCWLPLRAGHTYLARVNAVREGGDSPLQPEGLVLSVGPRLASRLPVLEPGSLLRVITETAPDLEGVQTAIGGGPALVRGGVAMKWPGLQFRHPRTAVGWNRASIFLVQVDGRQNDLSVGMSFPELAGYMRKLGCDEAMNLDGGGSATCWVLGNVMNNPSEGQERPAANALVVVEKRGPAK